MTFEDVDWSKRGEYIAKHGTTPEQAGEALSDPARLVIDPDPASKSGESVRIIGWSQSANRVLTVIVLEHEGTEYGVNCWPANDRDQSLYHTTEDEQRP
ncbi:transposase [Nocardia brasiliensis]|uniref:transposase n=1 Tax=Nocardia brasiliensis TaxID=37326 RepID=UPI003D8A8716